MLVIVFIVSSLVLVQNGLAADNDVQESTVDLSKYVDVRMRIFIGSLDASDLMEGMPQFLIAMSNGFLIGRDQFGPMICVQFEEHDNSIWRIRVDIPKDLMLTDAENFVKQIDEAKKEKRQDDECKKNDQRRPGAHLAQIKFSARGNKERGRWIGEAVGRMSGSGSDEVVVISVRSFKHDPSDAEGYYPIMLVNTSAWIRPIDWWWDHRDRPKPTFANDATTLVDKLWTELRLLIADCPFSTNASKVMSSPCYFVHDGYCGYDSTITRADKPEPSASSTKFCYDRASFVLDERCANSTICTDECQRQLRDVPCPSACGPQTKELPKTDVRTKFCPSVACETKRCDSSVDDGYRWMKVSTQKTLGIALIVVGLVFVIGSGIGLGVLWFVFFHKKRRGRRGFIKSGPIIIVGKKMKKTKIARKSLKVSPDQSPSGPTSKTARAVPGSKSDRSGSKKKRSMLL